MKQTRRAAFAQYRVAAEVLRRFPESRIKAPSSQTLEFRRPRQPAAALVLLQGLQYQSSGPTSRMRSPALMEARMKGRKIPVQHGLASPKNPRGFLNCSKAERTDQSSLRLNPHVEAIAICMSVPAI
jgi:hypothetical protein